MNNRKAFEIAYMKVFNVGKKQVNKPQHQKIIRDALTDVWSYPELFPGETEKDKDYRLDLVGPANGEVSELIEHFRGIPGFEYLSGLSSYESLFEIYKRMNSVEEATRDETSEDEESISVEDVIEKKEDDDTLSEYNNILIKEDMNMSEKAISALEAMQAGMKGQAGGSVAGNESAPKADNATSEAVNKYVNEHMDDRLNTTKNSTVAKIVVTQPAAKDRAVDGEKATGEISKPELAYSKFMKNFGGHLQEDGSVVFDHCFPGDEEKARKIFNVLKAAVEGDKHPIKANVSTSLGSIKGFLYEGVDGGEGEYLDKATMITLIMDKTVGALKTPAKEVVISLSAARAPRDKKNAGAGATRTVNKEKNAVPSIKIQGRKDAADHGLVEFYKVINKDKEAQLLNGFKSELAASYTKPGELDAKGQEKKATYRIPLLVMQYVTEVTDPKKKEAFPEGQGFNQKTIDLNSEDGIKAAVDSMIAAIAESTNLGATGEIFDAIRKEKEAADAKVMQDEMNNIKG